MSSTRVPRQRLAPRNVPKQARSEATVEVILEAAAQVFERHGYAAGTTNRIAERAGVSIGSIYQYFPNKDAILVALVRRHIDEGMAALGPQLARLEAGSSFDEVLSELVEAMVALHALAPGLHRVLFEETQLPASLRTELYGLEDRLVELAAEALGPSFADARLTARVLISTIEGLTHRLVLRPPAEVGAEAIAREITELVRAYLEVSRQPHLPRELQRSARLPALPRR
jgi:AcrR family transcriptional regulator